MKKKTADLIDGELDYWVARAEGHECHISIAGRCIVTARSDGMRFGEKGAGGLLFTPSTEWRLAGPIIERAGICVGPRVDMAPIEGKQWGGYIDAARPAIYEWGTTALVAAMRAYVASVFGNEVGL